MRGQRGQHRQLVDESRHVRGPHRERAVAAVADPDGALPLAGPLDDLQQVHDRPRPLEPGEDAGAGGIEPHVLEGDVRAGEGGGGGRPERGGRQVAGHGQPGRPQALSAAQGDAAVDLTQLGAEHREGQLRMVPGGGALSHRGVARRVEPGQEHRALDLGARDRRRVVDALEPRAGDGEGRATPVSRHPRPHPREGFDDPPHRPAAERAVPGDDAGEPMAGESAGQQPEGRAGVAGVEGTRRRSEAADAAAVDGHDRPAGRPAGGPGPLHADPERTEARQGGGAVGARRVAVDGRPALGQRREQRVAVRNRLVAGYRDAAPDAGGGLHDDGRHRQHYIRVGGGEARGAAGLAPSGERQYVTHLRRRARRRERGLGGASPAADYGVRRPGRAARKPGGTVHPDRDTAA